MSFDGDAKRLEDESIDDGFGAMLEDSASLMARLSFHLRSVSESRRDMERRYHESQDEVGRMCIALDESAVHRDRLIGDVVAAYDRDVKEGSIEG